jgi:putative exporter of polyketide antibiotics
MTWLKNAWNWLTGWRTVALNVLAGLPALWDTTLFAVSAFVPLAQQYSLFNYVPEKWKPLYALALVLMNVALRFQTRTPIGVKK